MEEKMNIFEEKAIGLIGKRSYGAVLLTTSFFALAGSALTISTGGIGI